MLKFYFCFCSLVATVTSFSGPVGLNLKISLKPERRDDFFKVIQNDAKQTVATEPGALQFTLGEDTEKINIFYLHEQYKEMKDVEHHQTTPHFDEWQAFCETEPFTADPVIDVYRRYDGDAHSPGITGPGTYCLNVELCIRPEVRDTFMECILNNQRGSRNEPLCLQYDFGESVETPNSFYFHEQYKGADGGREGFEAHAASPHFAAWEEFAATGPFTKPPVVAFYRTMG
eukprot:CAMPEP_0194272574 /NCGR_PEP_ID=MMETSP0169-20130528/6110_1 /TAXON_ID=218684 /ORGANISM="Corethron pennatum, Strain L29A3" /LENGTH=229 /DNA_ID=CAMNT_0039015275 /DNA_START=82 /DNA_END=771 /DNA_ORIENTATION=-